MKASIRSWRFEVFFACPMNLIYFYLKPIKETVTALFQKVGFSCVRFMNQFCQISQKWLTIDWFCQKIWMTINDVLSKNNTKVNFNGVEWIPQASRGSASKNSVITTKIISGRFYQVFECLIIRASSHTAADQLGST